MSYRVKRIDPFWMNNPILPAIAVVGIVGALALVAKDMIAAAVASAVVGGIAVILTARPAVTATMAALGLLGGATTFLIYPNAESAGMTLPMKLLATLLFGLFYAIVMDGVVLLIAVLYNFFSTVAGLGGLSLDLDVEEDAPSEG
jgi:hypothetical protein